MAFIFENSYCNPSITTSAPKWDTLDWVIMHVWPKSFGGGRMHLENYKNAWVIHNKINIINAARKNNIPVDLLAGVAWIEVGGKPDGVKRPAYFFRTVYWSGTDSGGHNFNKNPSKTSFGAVSIQLRRSAAELGFDAESMSFLDQNNLITCLQNDVFNLDVVAKHLHNLILFDYPGINTNDLSEEQIIVAGSRYNRGTERLLQDIITSNRSAKGLAIREYSEYGRSIIRRRVEIANLLNY
jgi:hypothetical protein